MKLSFTVTIENCPEGFSSGPTTLGPNINKLAKIIQAKVAAELHKTPIFKDTIIHTKVITEYDAF